MKGDQVTSVDIKKWKEDGRIPVACRLCGEVMLFSSKFYKEEDLVGYECANCKMILKLMGRR